MDEWKSHETPNMYPNLSVPLNNQQEFKLNIVNKIKYYFDAGIKERELMSKRLSTMKDLLRVCI